MLAAPHWVLGTEAVKSRIRRVHVPSERVPNGSMGQCRRSCTPCNGLAQVFPVTGSPTPPRPARQGPDESNPATGRSPERGHTGSAPLAIVPARGYLANTNTSSGWKTRRASLDHPKLHFDAHAARTQSRAFVTRVPISTELTATLHRTIARCHEPPKLAPGTTHTATASAGLTQSPVRPRFG